MTHSFPTRRSFDLIINQINEGRDCHTLLCPPFDRRRDPMQFFRIRLHLIIALSIMLGCFSTQAWARTIKTTDGVEATVSLSGGLVISHDPHVAPSVDVIPSGGAHILLTPIPYMPHEGYHKGAVWARFFLSAPSVPKPSFFHLSTPP